VASEAPTEASSASEQKVRPEYTGDKGDFANDFVRDMVVEKKAVPNYTYGARVRVAAIWENYEKMFDHLVVVGGWARTTRMGGKDFCFVELNDGSCSRSLQVVVDSTMPGFDEVAKSITGASYKFKGKLIKSPKDGQPFELQVCDPEGHSCKVLGQVDGSTYKLGGKKKIGTEILREIAHLRPRTKLVSAVTRVRNSLSYATHKFFQDRGFLYIHTPLITASDCEGAGEMFQVTTAMPDPHTGTLKNLPTFERVG
jgi:asparaginyl-tRNA synthetase